MHRLRSASRHTPPRIRAKRHWWASVKSGLAEFGVVVGGLIVLGMVVLAVLAGVFAVAYVAHLGWLAAAR